MYISDPLYQAATVQIRNLQYSSDYQIKEKSISWLMLRQPLPVSWDSGYKMCKKFGMQLPVPTTMEEFDAINSLGKQIIFLGISGSIRLYTLTTLWPCDKALVSLRIIWVT